jgi:hypothetical protein
MRYRRVGFRGVEAGSGAVIGVDDAVVARMVADTCDAEALPLLAFALERLAAGVGRGGWLTSERSEQIGGVAGRASATPPSSTCRDPRSLRPCRDLRCALLSSSVAERTTGPGGIHRGQPGTRVILTRSLTTAATTGGGPIAAIRRSPSRRRHQEGLIHQPANYLFTRTDGFGPAHIAIRLSQPSTNS